MKITLVRKVLSCALVALLHCPLGYAQTVANPTAEAQEKEAKLLLASMGLAVSPTVLVQYAAQGDVAVVKLLLRSGVAVTSAEALRKVTALHNAAAQGHLRLVSQLLLEGADVNAQDVYGATPLVCAVYAGHVEVVKLLLAKGADATLAPVASPSAMNMAIQRNDMAVFELLRNTAQQSTQTPDVYGNTALMQAQVLKRTAMVERLQLVK